MNVIIGAQVSRYRHVPGPLDHRMAYLLGFRQLGHDVFLMEDFDPDLQRSGAEAEIDSVQRNFEHVTKSYGIWPRCSLIGGAGSTLVGPPFCDLMRIAREADLLVNIDGLLKTPDILDAVRCKVYIDTAPAKAQVYQSEYNIDRGIGSHDFLFTVGLNIGTPKSPIPTCGRVWRPIFPPVALSDWPARMENGCRCFTTVSGWGGQHTFKLNGIYSGKKKHQWRNFQALPQHTAQRLEIALRIGRGYEGEVQKFTGNGWSVRDAGDMRDLTTYRDYIGGSRAEFSVANSRYVTFNTGWFSDRTVRYMGSGKPALLQGTGIEDHLPVGEGVLTFRTMEEAVAGIDAINGNYALHCRAARAIAEEYFAATKVAGQILAVSGLQG